MSNLEAFNRELEEKNLRDPRGREVLERLGAVSSWKQCSGRKAQRRGDVLVGRGVAFGDRHIGTGESSAELFLEPGGGLRLATSVRDVGVGAYTMHRQVAAEILGVPPELVQIDVRGTDTGSYDEGVRGQRRTHVEGQAVARAANALVETLRQERRAFGKSKPSASNGKRDMHVLSAHEKAGASRNWHGLAESGR